MFRGLIFAAALAAGTLDVHGRSHHSDDAATPHSQSRLQVAAPPTIPVGVQNDINSIARALNAANSHPYAAEDRQRSKDELKAQQDTVLWAAMMFVVASLETIVTAVGVVLVWKTLTASRDAAREAKRAADAAEKSIKVTRNIGRAQVRAYVNIKAADVRFIAFGKAEADHPQVTIVAKNTGNSPAKKFRWDATIQYIVAPGRKRERNLLEIEKQANIVGAQIPAGEEFTESALIAEMMLNQVAAECNPPVTSVLVRLRIDYEYLDVFEHKIEGSAYFAAIVGKINRDGDRIWVSGGPDWRGDFTAMTKPNDW